MKRQFIDRKIFLKFLMTYLILITVFFGIFGMFFSKNIMEEEKKAFQEADDTITKQKQFLDEQILQTSNILYWLYNSTEISRLEILEKPYTPNDLIEMEKCRRQFGTLTHNLTAFRELSIYFKNLELFIGTKSVGVNPEIYYNAKDISASTKYQKWKENIRELKDPVLIADSENGNATGAFTLIQKIPESMMKNNAFLISKIEKEKIFELLETDRYYPGSYAYVLDQHGEILGYAVSEELGGKKVTKEQMTEWIAKDDRQNGSHTFSTQSDYLGITYYWTVTDSVLLKNSLHVKQLLFLTYGILLTVFILTAFLFTYRLTRPINLLVERISNRKSKGVTRDGDQYQFLEDVFDNMLDENTKLVQERQEYQDALIRNFFVKLLNGIYISEVEICSAKDHVPFIFASECYIVALLRLMEFDIIEKEGECKSGVPFYSMNKVCAVLDENMYAYKTDFDKFAVIFCMNTEECRDIVEEKIRQIQKIILEEDHLQTLCTVGKSMDICDRIYISYQNALHIMENESIGEIQCERSIVWYKDVQEKYQSYYYPIVEEQRIMNFISAGKIEESRELIHQLFEENYVQRHLEKREKKYFIRSLCTTFLRFSRQVSLQENSTDEYVERMIELINNTQFDQVDEMMFFRIINYYSIRFNNRKNEKQEQLCQSILQRIEENYHNPEFSLQFLADEMKFTENYLSIVFKQGTGENISFYIEKMRMKEAGHLLVNTDMLIKDIADQVGYYNLNTFYKAYKRIYGVTPSQYRNLHKN